MEFDYVLILTISQVSCKNSQDNFTIAFTRLVMKQCLKALHFLGMKKKENTAHNGKALFVCSNVVIYHKFLTKRGIACNHGFVNFNAHMKSIEGFDKPSKEILAKLGHGVINKAIANNLETLTISSPSAKHMTPLLHKTTPS